LSLIKCIKTKPPMKRPLRRMRILIIQAIKQ
jgi:hypothetical protein